MSAQSHIFLDPPPQSEKVVFTSTTIKNVKKMTKLKKNNRTTQNNVISTMY